MPLRLQSQNGLFMYMCYKKYDIQMLNFREGPFIIEYQNLI